MDYRNMFDKLAGEVVKNIGYLDTDICTKKVLTYVYRHIVDRETIYKAAWHSLYEESKKVKEDFAGWAQGEAAAIVIDAMESIAGGENDD